MTLIDELNEFGIHKNEAISKVAVLGVGNELNGDDAAGALVVRKLIAWYADQAQVGKQMLILEAGGAPEAFTGPLRRFGPQLVLFVDAAEMGETPGAVCVFDWGDAQGMSGSTHTLPPGVLAKFLVRELGCRVVLIGIQPAGLEFDTNVSTAVRAAVCQVADGIVAFWSALGASA